MKPDLAREISDLTEESPVELILEAAPELMDRLGKAIAQATNPVVLPPAVHVSVLPQTEWKCRMEVERNRDGWLTAAVFTFTK